MKENLQWIRPLTRTHELLKQKIAYSKPGKKSQPVLLQNKAAKLTELKFRNSYRAQRTRWRRTQKTHRGRCTLRQARGKVCPVPFLLFASPVKDTCLKSQVCVNRSRRTGGSDRQADGGLGSGREYRAEQEWSHTSPCVYREELVQRLQAVLGKSPFSRNSAGLFPLFSIVTLGKAGLESTPTPTPSLHPASSTNTSLPAC